MALHSCIRQRKVGDPPQPRPIRTPFARNPPRAQQMVEVRNRLCQRQHIGRSVYLMSENGLETANGGVGFAQMVQQPLKRRLMAADHL